MSITAQHGAWRRHMSVRIAVCLTAALLAWSGGSARASLSFTDRSFITLSDAGELQFTYEGYNALDTNAMGLSVGGGTVFITSQTPVGTVYTTGWLAAGTYRLFLNDLSTGDVWSSDPTQNRDGDPHLAYSPDFADFQFGSPTATVPAAMYFGWEDRPFPQTDGDYNDLIFTVVPVSVAEPEMGVALLSVGVLVLVWLRRRQRSFGLAIGSKR